MTRGHGPVRPALLDSDQRLSVTPWAMCPTTAFTAHRSKSQASRRCGLLSPLSGSPTYRTQLVALSAYRGRYQDKDQNLDPRARVAATGRSL